MGNTPSNQSGASSSTSGNGPTRRASTSHSLRTPSRQQNPHGIPQSQQSDLTMSATLSSGQNTAPVPNRPVSPRRRKSLELPDLNSKLAFTSGRELELPVAEPENNPLSPISSYPISKHEGDNILGNTPPRSAKRMSLTSGTRARSPSSTIKSALPISAQLDHMSSANVSNTNGEITTGVPILGARPTRRIDLIQDDNDNPYFPPVISVRNRAPTTPGLPNYSHSPAVGGNSGVGLANIQHTEDTAPLRTDQFDRLSVNSGALPIGPRQPSPARPAPAVVTTHHHHGTSNQEVTAPVPSQSLNNEALSPVHMSDAYGSAGDMPNTAINDKTPIGRPPQIQGFADDPFDRDIAEPSAKKEDDEASSAVPTLVTWNEGGKDVYVTGTFASGGWKARLKMNKSSHDFSLLLNLPPGTHRLKFIVDDRWRCSSELQTATDGDGNLVNWLEVEPLHKKAETNEDWQMAEWAQKLSNAEMEEDDPSLWTDVIPPALSNFITIEERSKEVPPDNLSQTAYTQYHQNIQSLLASVPIPPALPRHLDKVILNTTPKELEGTVGGTAGDDNSILPVPNHVVLNHLTAAAIKNGTLAVGTTTRYKRKYITTVVFKPVGDH